MFIDFVMPWVDGNDPEWIQEFNKYAPQKKNANIDISAERYRDNGLLRYWFRGIEKNAPWVRKVFFITNGQKPDWLNINNEKLCWVKHKDYIPNEYLPVFSANPIENHLHRIADLSEHFVFFNDDTYLVNPVKEELFFLKNLPCDYAVLRPMHPSFFEHIILNDLIEINKHFNKQKVIKANFSKYINIMYGAHLLRRCYLSRMSSFPGFYYIHAPQAFLKDTFRTVWDNCEEVLVNTSKNRFRSIADVNQYLFRYWQLVTGKFTPQCNFNNKRNYDVDMECIKEIKGSITGKTVKTLCLNDDKCSAECYDIILKFFENKFPEKSSFEV